MLLPWIRLEPNFTFRQGQEVVILVHRQAVAAALARIFLLERRTGSASLPTLPLSNDSGGLEHSASFSLSNVIAKGRLGLNVNILYIREMIKDGLVWEGPLGYVCNGKRKRFSFQG